jgi:phosphatidylserine/phosphatidylglycerophosphate/cardiolipin synthase-like enzyme
MNIPTYKVQSAAPVQDMDYLPFILDQIDEAKIRVWASIFIVDARVHTDELRSVRSVLERLTYATWRNVDVRVIIGTAKIEDVFVACLTSANYMRKRGLNVRQYASPWRKSTHSKYMLFDDELVLVGSNNWSHNSLNLAVNSSLAVASPGLNTALSLRFDEAWQTSKESSYES